MDHQGATGFMARDANAQVSVISGAWAVPLFRSARAFSDLRAEAARLQKIESRFLDILRDPATKASVRIWTMADFAAAPLEPLQAITDTIGPKSSRRLSDLPKMVDLTGFGQFLQDLKNEGMHPYLMGDFPVDTPASHNRPDRTRKPYQVKK